MSFPVDLVAGAGSRLGQATSRLGHAPGLGGAAVPTYGG
jgi:hypothetical protein